MVLNKNLSILLGGQLVSQMGDKLYMLALAYMVLEKTQSPGMMGVVLFCSLFPAMVLGAVAGVFIDRYNKKWFIVGADFIRGGIVTFVGIAFYYDFLNLTGLILAQLLISVCSAFFDPAIPAIIPQIVKKEQLAKTNSMAQFIDGFSTIVGPILGGLVVAAYGYLFILVFNAFSYIISGVFECFLKLNHERPAAVKSTSLKRDLVEGFHYIKSNNQLFLMLVIISIIHFFVGSLEVVFPILAMDLQGKGAENLGYLKTAFGGGMVTMAFGMSLYSLHNKEEKSLFGSLTVIGFIFVSIALALFSQIQSIPIYLLLFVLFGGFIIIASTSFRTILQKQVDSAMTGRVFGVVASVSDISLPVAMLIYGGLFSYVDYKFPILITGGCLMLFSWLAYLKYKPPTAITTPPFQHSANN